MGDLLERTLRWGSAKRWNDKDLMLGDFINGIATAIRHTDTGFKATQYLVTISKATRKGIFLEAGSSWIFYCPADTVLGSKVAAANLRTGDEVVAVFGGTETNPKTGRQYQVWEVDVERAKT